jgi:hypothetical protein
VVVGLAVKSVQFMHQLRKQWKYRFRQSLSFLVELKGRRFLGRFLEQAVERNIQAGTEHWEQ